MTRSAATAKSGAAGPRQVEAVDATDLTERIERVATELFIRNGYHGVSYLGIGKELGITHSNVHYYYRNKSALAEGVLKRAAADTVASTTRIWRDGATTLVDKFVLMRNWIYRSFLHFNPDGKGGRPWGLLSRFSMEADALTPEMKQVIRTTLKKLEADVRYAVEAAVKAKDLGPESPVDGISLQILSVIPASSPATHRASTVWMNCLCGPAQPSIAPTARVRAPSTGGNQTKHPCPQTNWSLSDLRLQPTTRRHS